MPYVRGRNKKPSPVGGKPEKTPKGIPPKNKPTDAAAALPHGTSKSVVATQGFEEAILTCKTNVEKIAKECRIANRKYRDSDFDLSWDGRYCLDGLTVEKPHLNPASTLRVEEVFENPKFYKDGVSAGDIEQGATGDCWFLAAVATISSVPGLLEKICVARDEAVGVYGFIFMRDGEWISTIVDDQLYTTRLEYQDSDVQAKSGYHGTEQDYTRDFMRGSKALYFGKCHDPNETWLPLLEKAYVKAHGDYGAIEDGCPGEAVEDLTGGVTTEFLTSDLLDRNRFWTDEFLLVNKDFLFAASISGPEDRAGILVGHSYSVLKVKEVKGEKFVLVRNPWGHSEWTGAWSDGSKEWTAEWLTLLDHRFGDDGAWWMSYKDFLHKFDHIEQTRLFDTTWTVTARWVKVPVPWAMEYSATRFEVAVAQKGPVVFVLSQLDHRYFRGLRGQYKFSMHFRVHRDDEVEYIARSRSNVDMSRSVSTELELEPGRYRILFKITAEKMANAKTMEQVTNETCRVDRKKFLQIGTSYDLAHDKISAEPEDKSKIEAAEASRAAKPAIMTSTVGGRSTVAGKSGKSTKGSGGNKEKEKSDEDTGSESDSSSSSKNSSSSSSSSGSSSSGSSSSSSSDSSGSGSSSRSAGSDAPSAAVSAFMSTTESIAVGGDDDVWDAIACVGLRVYSQSKDLTVAVVHADTADLEVARDMEKGEEGDDEKKEKKSKKGGKGQKDKKKDKKKGKKKEDKEEDDDEKSEKKKEKDGEKGEKGEKDKKDSKKKDKKKSDKGDKSGDDEEKVKDKKKKDKKEEGEKDEKKEKGEKKAEKAEKDEKTGGETEQKKTVEKKELKGDYKKEVEIGEGEIKAGVGQKPE